VSDQVSHSTCDSRSDKKNTAYEGRTRLKQTLENRKKKTKMKAANISIYSVMQPRLVLNVLTEITKYTPKTNKTRDIKIKYSESPAHLVPTLRSSVDSPQRRQTGQTDVQHTIYVEI
jgi:hypothetical protein